MRRLLAYLISLFIPFLSFGEYSDYFSVSYDGKVICGGDTLVITERNCNDGACSYMPHFTITNETENEYLILGTMLYTDTPSKAMLNSDPDYWGRPQFCMSSCYANGDDTKVGYGIEELSDRLHCFPEVMMCSNEATSKYVLRISVCYGTPENYVEINDSAFEITLVFTEDKTAGTKIIEGSEQFGTEEYYDLHGRRIANPGKGIYIKAKNRTSGIFLPKNYVIFRKNY